jgi:DNA-directed RNA polymerase specialized sigma24 family protein
VSIATPANGARLHTAIKQKTNGAVSAKVVQDRRLVDRCLAGDITAWSALYAQFHDTMLSGIRAFLGRSAQDLNLVEEIAARVWYALVKNDSELLNRFDVSRGCRFSTFLSLVAKNEARILLRSEKRRRKRELMVSRLESEPFPSQESIIWLSDEDFILTLSPAERAFYVDVLMADKTEVNGHPTEYTDQNRWQLRSRIRRKLERYIAEAS